MESNASTVLVLRLGQGDAKRSRDLDPNILRFTFLLHPLRERPRTMRAELDARNEDVSRLEEENHRSQE